MKRTLAGLMLLALWLAFASFARAQDASFSDALLNDRLAVPADGQTHAFVFSPTANNLYAFQSFGAGEAEAALYLIDEPQPIDRATGFRFEARLIADATYRLEVSAQNAPVEVEVMRSALGRSFDQAIVLTEPAKGYDKSIARAYDTHWFRFTAPTSGLCSIRSSSQINTVGYLLDEAGNRLAVSDNLYSPYGLDFRIQHHLTAGRTYYVRVSGRGEETGAYHLTLALPDEGQGPPSALRLSAQTLTLEEGGTARLSYAVEPQGALGDAVFLSADPRVASVSPDGEVVALNAGQTQIILSGVAGVEARATLTVEQVPATGLELLSQSLELHAGELSELACRVLPERASNRRVRLVSSDPAVLSIDREGRLCALKPGEAVVTVTTEDGGFQAEARVTVKREKSRYRALIMGEQRYADGRVRTGSINTAQGLADTFARQRYGGKPPEVTLNLDVSADEAVALIRAAFADAQPTDVNILYINCHGGLTGRQAWLEFHDGSRLSAKKLERMLRRIPGTIVLMIDCCQSGSFISGTAQASFNRRMAQTFFPGSGARFLSSKYRLLTSTSSVQDSWRFSSDGTDTEDAMSTAFGRSLAEAGGWDLIADKPTRLRADLNQDKRVTLHEAYLYARSRVTHFLARAGVRQDVQVYPAGSPLTLFEK
ncbi:Ig-like domain-containing protein [Bacillota bacterium Meth-B3]